MDEKLEKIRIELIDIGASVKRIADAVEMFKWLLYGVIGIGIFEFLRDTLS